MANTVSITLLNDGPRNTQVELQCAINTADQAQTLLIDPAVLQGMDNTGALKAATFRVKEVLYSIQDGLAVQFLWNAATPVQFLDIAGRGKMDFNEFGGLKNPLAAGANGQILFSTQGWSTGTVNFTVLLKLEKVQAAIYANIAGTYNPATGQPYQERYANIGTTIPNE
jgi:hypothetical protein